MSARNPDAAGDGRRRCEWCGDDPLYVAYHDEEWGVPCRDDQRLFEMLILEGAQAGLAWITILRKREGYRRAFAGFDAGKVARFDDREQARLREDPGIVRNRLKIAAAVDNARAWLELLREEGSAADFLWSFTGGKTLQNRWASSAENPAHTAESDAMSRALKHRGFRFVGSTICYAFMQATGMVNDHRIDCFRHEPLAGGSRA